MKLYKNTVSELLWETLVFLMQQDEIKPFRLVGGTCLSLILGHRKSIDIDLFTDSNYGSIDFQKIDSLISVSFDYADFNIQVNNGLGKTYYVGKSKQDCIKLDLFYTDKYVFPLQNVNGIRMASLEEVAAMKLEVIGFAGRKKDFWDLHEILEHRSLESLLEFYAIRYPYSHSLTELKQKLTDFRSADLDFDPICLKGKYWELIKLDIEELTEKLR